MFSEVLQTIRTDVLYLLAPFFWDILKFSTGFVLDFPHHAVEAKTKKSRVK